jgi:hypothetical protein
VGQPSGAATPTHAAGREAREPAYRMVVPSTATAPSVTTPSGVTTDPSSSWRSGTSGVEVTTG